MEISSKFAAISLYMNFLMKSRQLKCFERNQWIVVWEFKHPPLHNNHLKSIETPDSHTWLRGGKNGVTLFIKEHFLKDAFPFNISFECFLSNILWKCIIITSLINVEAWINEENWQNVFFYYMKKWCKEGGLFSLLHEKLGGGWVKSSIRTYILHFFEWMGNCYIKVGMNFFLI